MREYTIIVPPLALTSEAGSKHVRLDKPVDSKSGVIVQTALDSCVSSHIMKARIGSDTDGTKQGWTHI